MKIVYARAAVLLLAGFLFFTSSCSNKSGSDENPEQQSVDSPGVKDDGELYVKMREMALATTADQIGNNDVNSKVYGVIMDWDFGEGIATLISFASGDASLYLSSGGAVIGGAGHDNIKHASKAFVEKSEKYLSKALKTETTPMPGKGKVKFYFLTREGKFVAEEEIINLENNSSEWQDLFEEANKLITEIRTSTPEK